MRFDAICRLQKGGEHNMADLNTIRKAIEEARREHASLLDALKEYEKTKLRVEQLESFINMGVALLGDEKLPQEEQPRLVLRQPREPNITEARDGSTLTSKPIQEGMNEILKESPRKLTLREIAEEFRKRSWKLSEKNSREVLRGVVKKHRDSYATGFVNGMLVVGLKGIHA
jgi:hypothetical protein